MILPIKGPIAKFLDERTAHATLDKIISEFEDQSKNPPGKDPVIAACYLAAIELIKQDPRFKNFLLQIIKKRTDLTAVHFINLFFRSLQYIKLFRQKGNYLKIDWKKDLKNFLSNQKLKNELMQVMINKDTSTTKYQRYISLYALINWFFPKRAVAIADFGCGGNYGLKGLELEEKFETVIDETPGKFFLRLLRNSINLKFGLGIDKEDPDNETTHNWRIACSFYPQELNKINSVLEFEKRIQAAKKVDFLRNNLVSEKINTQHKFDIVIISTVLYQISSSKNRQIIINKAKKILKGDGVLIIQDFANLDKTGNFDFSQSWFNKPFTYNTFIASSLTNWRFLWIFSWENGRSLKVKSGQDLKLLFDGYLPNSSSAAFAHSAS